MAGLTLAAGVNTVTFNTLLDEMANLDALADYPTPYFTCRQFSSYDRKSHNKTDLSDEGWFSNGDACQVLRTETRRGREEFVLMDAEGPGAIVRIWSANAADAGLVRIYLDHSDVPKIEMPLANMLNGENELFIPPISGIRANGWNSYMPIPYSKHCKVTIEQNRIYYHINYRTYPKDTAVETFSLRQAKENLDNIKRTADLLTHPEQINACREDKKDHRYRFHIQPGQTEKIKLSTPQTAIYNFTCTLNAENQEQALRKCLLEIAFDNLKTPGIQTPLGDFFGSAPGINPFTSLPLEVGEDGTMTCRWVMPFKHKAIIKFTNYSDKPVQLDGRIQTGSRKWGKQTMYFNAKWKSGMDIPARPRIDWNYLDCRGQGRYVGNMFAIGNPVSSWWGEGDEKIYLDGEDFPSTFGTGTEDYYGYAWCSNQLFTHAYHNQTRCDGPNNQGHASVSRFHIIDSLPFAKSFRFDMEIWHHATGFTLDVSEISYWYAKPGVKDNFKSIAKNDLIVPAIPAPVKAREASEAEEMRVIQSTGIVFNQTNYVWYYSGGKATWWHDNKPGDILELGFIAEKAGRYSIHGKFTEGAALGIHSLFINDQPADTYDRFNPDWKADDAETPLGVFDLKQGENILKVVCQPTSPKSLGTLFTLDYLRLIRTAPYE
jgi:hypothetical protein